MSNINQPPAPGAESIEKMCGTLDRLGYKRWADVPEGLVEAIAVGWETGSRSPDGRWLQAWIIDQPDGFSTTAEILDAGISLDHLQAASSAGDCTIDTQVYGGRRRVDPTGHGRCADQPCAGCLERDAAGWDTHPPAPVRSGKPALAQV